MRPEFSHCPHFPDPVILCISSLAYPPSKPLRPPHHHPTSAPHLALPSPQPRAMPCFRGSPRPAPAPRPPQLSCSARGPSHPKAQPPPPAPGGPPPSVLSSCSVTRPCPTLAAAVRQTSCPSPSPAVIQVLSPVRISLDGSTPGSSPPLFPRLCSDSCVH